MGLEVICIYVLLKLEAGALSKHPLRIPGIVLDTNVLVREDRRLREYWRVDFGKYLREHNLVSHFNNEVALVPGNGCEFTGGGEK